MHPFSTSLIHPARELVAVDLETTGLDPQLDRIIEIGAVRFAASGAILATFERLVNPLQPSGKAAQAIHGIQAAELADAEPAASVLPGFVAFLGDPRSTTVLAHHSAGDAGFLGNELRRAGLTLPDHPVIDTLAWARRCWPRLSTHRLESLAQRVDATAGPAHRALADSMRVRAVFLALRRDDPDPARPPLAYPFHEGGVTVPIPWGWEPVAAWIERAGLIEIEYAGGSRGAGPRRITPRSFAYRGGVAYLVAACQLDGKIKEFQVERIRSWRLVPAEPPRDGVAGTDQE